MAKTSKAQQIKAALGEAAETYFTKRGHTVLQFNDGSVLVGYVIAYSAANVFRMSRQKRTVLSRLQRGDAKQIVAYAQNALKQKAAASE